MNDRSNNPKDYDSIDSTYQKLSANAEVLYEFVLLYSDYMYRTCDYGNGDPIKMVEVHTLTMIETNPGITVSDLAKMWKRTKGTVSVNVGLLEKKGYIYREKHEGNAKVVHLYPTEKGKNLSMVHKAYDNLEIVQTRAKLLQTCTQEELTAYDKVIRAYLEILQESDTKN